MTGSSGRINEAGSRRQLQEAETGAWGRIRRQENQVRDRQSSKKEAAPGDSKHEHNLRGDRTAWKEQKTGLM